MYNGQNRISWDPNSEPDLAGYYIYSGSVSLHYDTPRTLATTGLFQVVTGLDSGQVWYHAVTAYDLSGNESTFSAEVSKLVVASVLNLVRTIK